MLNRLKGLKILLLIILVNSVLCSDTYFVIEQCPGTDVNSIRHQTEFNEISLIFYYTQWSDESLEALQQFNDVAAYFGDKIYFAAVDCWHLACNCSKTLSTTAGSGSPHKWPTLMVHYGKLGQLKIQYNGLFTFRYLVQFVINVMQPLERIEGKDDLEQIKTFTDAIVMGTFGSPKEIEYAQYLMAALKWLEHDPLRTFRFTVTFDATKGNFNKTSVKEPNILLLRDKTTKSFAEYEFKFKSITDSDIKWNASNILHWLREELNDAYSVLHGYSTPIRIGQKMKKQPVLAVFVNEPQKFFSYMAKHVEYHQYLANTLLACNSFRKRKSITKKWKKSLHIPVIMHNFNSFTDTSKCHYYSKDVILKNLNLYYEINHYFELYHKHTSSAKSSLNYTPNLEVQELLDFFQSNACLENKDIALHSPLHISVAKRLEGFLAKEQHGKSSNHSLTVILLDTQRYKDFLENIDLSPTSESMATVFIIHNDNESMYVMKDRFSINNLLEFAKQFSSNNFNNYYKNKKAKPDPNSSSLLSNYDIELKQLNRNIFLNNLQYTHNQTLIMLIYSPDCALCGNIQHSFLQLSLLLRHIRNLKFLRINSMENDLPWQFNMPFLPALLVFPENRFSESRLFPAYLKPDIRNVFGFIISRLPAHEQLKIILAVCQGETLPKSHKKSCWQFAKTILMQNIGKHLQYWEMFEAERSLILERLSAFKDMNIDIQSNLRL